MYVFGGATTAGTGVDMVNFFKSRKPAAKRADSRLTPAKHVVSTVNGNRTVLLDSRSGHYYGLDEVGSRIWGLAEAGFPTPSITEKLAAEYDVPPEQLEQDVNQFISVLTKSRLLEDR